MNPHNMQNKRILHEGNIGASTILNHRAQRMSCDARIACGITNMEKYHSTTKVHVKWNMRYKIKEHNSPFIMYA